jgi:hypothetical protein
VIEDHGLQTPVNGEDINLLRIISCDASIATQPEAGTDSLMFKAKINNYLHDLSWGASPFTSLAFAKSEA